MSVWETNASTAGVAGVTLNLKAAPSSLGATFTFGCGTKNGTASCSIGKVNYPESNERQLQAQINVASTDSSVTSATLTATAVAKSVHTDPVAAVTEAVDNASSSTTTGTDVSAARNANLPVGDNAPPTLNGTGSYLSNGGTASGLFPTINPTAVPTPSSGTRPHRGDPPAVMAADASTLPLGMPVVDAQIAGLVALAVALVLAVTRLSVRKRPGTGQPHKT